MVEEIIAIAQYVTQLASCISTIPPVQLTADTFWNNLITTSFFSRSGLLPALRDVGGRKHRACSGRGQPTIVYDRLAGVFLR